jgi:hypothetical protein
MLEYSTHRRYGSADEVLSDLGRIDRYVVRSRRVDWVKKQKKVRAIIRTGRKTAIALATVGAIAIVGWGLGGAGSSLFQAGSHVFSSGDPSIAIVLNHLLNISGWIFTFGAIAAGIWIIYEVVADEQPLVFIIKQVVILIGMGMSVYAIAKLILALFM